MEHRTARLTLRPITLADMEPLHTLYSDPALMRYIIGRPRTREETRERLEAHVADYAAHGIGLYLTYLTATGELVGRCGVRTHERPGGLEGGLAWMFLEPWWGQGLATEFARAFVPLAFAHAPYARLYAHADHRNDASINVMRKLGMRYVGREAWAPDLYEVEYELTRAMFEAGRPHPPALSPAGEGDPLPSLHRGGAGGEVSLTPLRPEPADT
jgi:[ribosomal protein S5]-alanine N-acetyltransferase